MIEHIPSMVSLVVIFITFGLAYRKGYGITMALLISNFVIFFMYQIYPDVMDLDLAFKTIYLYMYPQKIYTIVTTLFLHADLWHIFGNMLTLFFLGIPFEKRVGWRRFSLIYFLSGIGGTLFYSIINPKPIFLIGASGAIFGILGAFALAYPLDEVVMPIPVFFISILTRIKVIYAAIFFGFLEFIMSFFSSGYDNVAHLAHVGGLSTGMILSYLILKERKVKIDVFEYRNLEEVSQDPALIERIRFESIPEVKREWMEDFARKYRCPFCGGRLVTYKGEILCKRCGTIFR